MTETTLDKLAEEYAQGKGHTHYHFLFEENAGSPVDFAKLCYKDGYQDGLNADRWKYMSKGEYPTEAGNYLIVYEVANALVRSIKFYNPIAKQFETTLPVIAWQHLADLPQKKEE